MSGEPYVSDETITLPVPANLAPKLAMEIYLPASKRTVELLRIGKTDLGHYRVVSLTTGMTPGGYPQLIATYQRILL